MFFDGLRFREKYIEKAYKVRESKIEKRERASEGVSKSNRAKEQVSKRMKEQEYERTR